MGKADRDSERAGFIESLDWLREGDLQIVLFHAKLLKFAIKFPLWELAIRVIFAEGQN